MMTSQQFSTFGEWVRARREAVDLPTIRDFQRALATANVVVTESAISQWERGVTTPSESNLLGMWTVLCVHGEYRRQVGMAMHGFAPFPPVGAPPRDPETRSASVA